jgi:hypothetical protein
MRLLVSRQIYWSAFFIFNIFILSSL